MRTTSHVVIQQKFTDHLLWAWYFIKYWRVEESYLAVSDSLLPYPMDYIVHGILQARILEWVAFPFFRGSSKPRDRTQVSHIAGGFFTSWATGEAQESWSG